LEVGSGKPEVGSWKPEVGSPKLEDGSPKFEEGRFVVNDYISTIFTLALPIKLLTAINASR
jgi:hypothetical protein